MKCRTERGSNHTRFLDLNGPMKKTISLKVNGLERSVEVEPRMTLLDMVREQFGLTGAKLGCDIQVCGACTLLLDGKPVSACSFLAVDADGCEVLTIEGLSANGKLHPLQDAFMEFGALQCGYCTSGFILTRESAARRMRPAFGAADSRLPGG